MTKQQAEAAAMVLDAAIAWWRHRRPLSFTPAMHLAEPGVNTATDTERALALAVASLVKQVGDEG